MTMATVPTATPASHITVPSQTFHAGRSRPISASAALTASDGDESAVSGVSVTSPSVSATPGPVVRRGSYHGGVIFKAVGDRRPYPDSILEEVNWTSIPPRTVRLDQLTTTRAQLDLNSLLSEDSTFYGDLFAHVVAWRGELYLEDGLHRALRSALHGRSVIHVRILEPADIDTPPAPGGTVNR